MKPAAPRKAESHEPQQVNVAEHLRTMAAQQPDNPALYVPADGLLDRLRREVDYRAVTYRQLDELSDRIVRALRSVDIARGTRVALMVSPSVELFALVFALFRMGGVPVMIDPGIGLNSIKSCLKRARPEVFIGVGRAQLARAALGWGSESLRISITVGPWIPGLGPTLESLCRDTPAQSAPDPKTKAEDLAAILFTSGSTGPPKGAVYTHGNFAAQVEAIRTMYDIRPGEVDLPTFPLFALFDPALGMTTVVPRMNPSRPAQANPERLVDAIERFGVTNMFGSPALLRPLGRWGKENGKKLKTLKRVISAGAPVPAEVMGDVRALLPEDARVVTPYGATECLPVSSIESREVLEETADRTAKGHGVCVGRAIAEADVRVIAIEDGPIETIDDAKILEEGQIGEIIVRGPMATHRYWEQPEHTALAKIGDRTGFWHRMGDLGYFDEQERLWFCGRKSQRVTGRERTWFTATCEGVFNAHRAVARSALVTLNAPSGSRPGICLELAPKSSIPEDDLIAELRVLGQSQSATEGINDFFVHPRFPVDIRHNAKIRRERLSEWASGKLRGPKR